MILPNCNGGAYTALFDIQLFQNPLDVGKNGSNWADIVKNMQQYISSSPFNRYAIDTGSIQGMVTFTGGCTGTYTVDPNSFGWSVEYDSDGSWHFYFSYLLTGSTLSGHVTFNAVTVDGQSVAASTIANDPKNDTNIIGATLCLGSSPDIVCLSALPIITTVSTLSVAAGSPGYDLNIGGSNFVTGSIVKWTGPDGTSTNLTTTIVSNTMITAKVPASLLVNPGTAQLYVIDPQGHSSIPQAIKITGGSGGLTLLHSATSSADGLSSGSCVTPPMVTNFSTGSSRVYVYFDVNGAKTGDTARLTFIRPDGVPYATQNSTVSAVGADGYACLSFSIPISGNAAASYPGTWKAQAFWNQSITPLFSANFTVSTGTSGLTVVTSLISNVNGVVNGTCATPPAYTDFTTASPVVWLYFNYSGATPGDSAKINFLRPDGSIFQSDSLTIAFANGCISAHINVAGTTAASLPGTWAVQVLWGASTTPASSLNFTLVQPLSLTGTTVLPQLVFGGGWYSAMYFANSTANTVSFPLSFVSDTGAPLNVASLGGSTAKVTLLANGTAIVETPNVGALSEGYVLFTPPPGVSGYGVFRQTIHGVPDQEAVVPFSSTSTTSTILTFDETHFVTAAAIDNLSATNASVTITVRDANGGLIGTSQLTLSPNAKTETVLSALSGLSGMKNNRGFAQFDASGGKIAVLGLRFYGTAFTSIPTTSGTPAIANMVLPQLAFGGGWYSALYFTNSTSASVSFLVNFIDDNGVALNLPSGSSSTQVLIPPNGTAIIEAPNVGPLNVGFAVLTLPNGVAGYGVFRQSIPGVPDQEAVVPFSSFGATSSELTFDDTNFTTAAAIVNPSSTPTSVTVTARDSDGNVIGTAQIPLGGNAKVEAVLRSLTGLSGVAGKRGSAQFSVTKGNVAVLGLRFYGVAFTSIPTAKALSQ